MTIYITNVNGDWWIHRPETPIYVLDTRKLSKDDQHVVEQAFLGGDRFEEVIAELGSAVYLELPNPVLSEIFLPENGKPLNNKIILVPKN